MTLLLQANAQLTVILPGLTITWCLLTTGLQRGLRWGAWLSGLLPDPADLSTENAKRPKL